MSDDVASLSANQMDALREIGNVGAGNSATALSQIINRRIDMNVPRVSIVPLGDVPDLVGGPDVMVVGVFLRVYGKAPSNILFLLPRDSAFYLVDMLMGKKRGDTQKLDFMDESALMEIGNILSGAYLNALFNFTNISLLPTIPALATDEPNNTPAITPAPTPAPVPQQPSVQNVARPMPTIAPVARVDQPMIPQIVTNNVPLQQPAVTAAPSLANIIANPSPVGQKVEQVQTFKSVVNQPIPEIVSDVVQKVEPIKPLEDDTLSLVTPIPAETVNAMPPTNVSDVPKIEMEKDLVPLVPEV